MSKTIHLIQRVQIASPCPASWDDMIGDDKSRFCSQCKLNVYNLSAMTEDEAERLIIAKEGKLCARIYRRSDGTVLTKDCPVGVRALQRHLMWACARTAAAVLFIAAATVSAIAGQRVRNTHLAYNGSEWVTVEEELGANVFTNVHESVSRWIVDRRYAAIAGAMIITPVPPPKNTAPSGTPCKSGRIQ